MLTLFIYIECLELKHLTNFVSSFHFSCSRTKEKSARFSYKWNSELSSRQINNQKHSTYWKLPKIFTVRMSIWLENQMKTSRQLNLRRQFFAIFVVFLTLMFINYKFAYFCMYELDHITTNTISSIKQPQCNLYSERMMERDRVTRLQFCKHTFIIMWVWKCFGIVRRLP